MATLIKDIIIAYSDKLEGISETPRLDVEILLCKVLGYDDRIKLMMNYDLELDDNQINSFLELFEKRRQKMPIAYILNKKEFMGFEFYVDENVLIPRPDTELIVEYAIDTLKNKSTEKKSLTVIDMCSGSGAIALSISKMVDDKKINTNFIAVDISPGAIEVIEKNSKNLGVKNIEIIESDLFKSEKLISLKGKVDIIVSNPPYIKEDVIPMLQDDVKEYEPHLALSGGKSGMDIYNRIIEDSRDFLSEDGIIILESGHDQADEISLKLKECGYKNICKDKDIQGIDRLVAAQKS
ncbi:peptide chain release factor N(5)-glutamine methyltransferase [Peptostreptococcus faecalis]|uniref:peptide chain release factor N(5)-glutamine methyltransferase n=1 Tax=Peptostreptococcus faecalis TaxID=2045015 RepID=UPI000C7A368B|nr:peptide chain release factor N(5)-glutamine methyltransferase [Peptostreptococcus faecalis]